MLARQAWDGQLIPEREPEAAPTTCSSPWGLHATEGRFGDRRNRGRSPGAASVGKLALGAGALLALGAGWALGRRGR